MKKLNLSFSLHRYLGRILTRRDGQGRAGQRRGGFGENLTLAGGHSGCPLRAVPTPNAADDARSLQLVLGWALEGHHSPHIGAAALQDLQRAQPGREEAAALPCTANTHTMQRRQQQGRSTGGLLTPDCKSVTVNGQKTNTRPRGGCSAKHHQCHSTAPLPSPPARSNLCCSIICSDWNTCNTRTLKKVISEWHGPLRIPVLLDSD